jgi:hypothetical protein
MRGARRVTLSVMISDSGRRDPAVATALQFPPTRSAAHAPLLSRTTLLLLCAVTQLGAQSPGTVELGLYGQITAVDTKLARFDSRTPLSLGVRGRVNLHRGIGVELEASTGTVDGVGDPLRRRYNQLVARSTVTLPLSEYSGLLLGAGLARTDYEVTYNFGPSALIGIRTVIQGRYALRSDAIFNYLPTSGAREFGLRTGLQIVGGPYAGATERDTRSGNLTVQAPGTIEAGAFGQQWRLHPIWNLRSGRSAGTRVGAFITSRSQFEVEATYWRQPVRIGGRAGQAGGVLSTGQTFRVTTFAFRYQHNLPIGTRTAVLAGIGPVRSSYEYVDHWGGSALAGARVALSRDVQLRSDVVANYLPRVGVIDYGARIGASVLLRLGR